MILIAGPCQIESRDHCLRMAAALVKITDKLKIDFVFKASYDKANRTRYDSARGVGLEEGSTILNEIAAACPVTTDIHEVGHMQYLHSVQVLQIPALLSRQTDLIQNVARVAHIINIKKGQFMAPGDMNYAVDKARAVNPYAHIWVTERGTCFGYHNLVVDYRSLIEMRNCGADNIIFDASHSVQLPSAEHGRSGGQRAYIEALARAALSVGVDGIFIETHDDPDNALSDGANSYPLHQMEELLKRLQEYHELSQRHNNNYPF